MILGVGIDLVESRRMQRELARGAWVAHDGVFTSGEIQRCSHGRGRAARYAACFAAKEATLKALGLPVDDLGLLREVEIGAPGDGGATIILHDRVKAEAERLGVTHIRASVAPAADVAGAVVILESLRE